MTITEITSPRPPITVTDGEQIRAFVDRDGQINVLATPGTGSRVPATFARGGPESTFMPTESLPPLVAFETWLEDLPATYVESISAGFGGIARQPGLVVIRRYVRDHLRHVTIRYDVKIEVLRPANTYRVSFGAFHDVTFAEPAGSSDSAVLSPNLFPAPQIVKGRDVVPINLHTTGASGRLVEYLHVGKLEHGLALRQEGARDFYAEIGEFELAGVRLAVNGVVQELGAAARSLSGPVIWMYVPGRGRFILSLAAHPEMGFQRSGEVRGNALSFSVDGDIFRVDSTGRIVSGSGTYWLYLRRDPEWLPDTQDRSRILLKAALAPELVSAK